MLDILYHVAFALAYAFIAARKDKHVEQFDWKDDLALLPGEAVRVTVEYVRKEALAFPLAADVKEEVAV